MIVKIVIPRHTNQGLLKILLRNNSRELGLPVVSMHVHLNPRSLKILFDNQKKETTTKDVFVSPRFGFAAHVFQPFWDDHLRVLFLHVRLQQLPTTKDKNFS